MKDHLAALGVNTQTYTPVNLTKLAKELGLCRQTLAKRMRAAGYASKGRAWIDTGAPPSPHKRRRKKTMPTTHDLRAVLRAHGINKDHLAPLNLGNVAKELGISRPTLVKYMRELGYVNAGYSWVDGTIPLGPEHQFPLKYKLWLRLLDQGARDEWVTPDQGDIPTSTFYRLLSKLESDNLIIRKRGKVKCAAEFR